jgi:hypothetical protein
MITYLNTLFIPNMKTINLKRMVHPSPPLTNSGQQHLEQWGTKVDLKPRVLNFLHINDHSLLKPLQPASDSYLILVLSESKHEKYRKDMVNMSVSLKLIQHKRSTASNMRLLYFQAQWFNDMCWPWEQQIIKGVANERNTLPIQSGIAMIHLWSQEQVVSKEERHNKLTPTPTQSQECINSK